MQLSDFTLTRNKQQPNRCFEYTKREGDTLFKIFTMNFALTYWASIEQRSEHSKRYNQVYSVEVGGILSALQVLNMYKYNHL